MYLGATEATSKQWLCKSFLHWYNEAKNYNYLRVPLNWLCLIRSKSVYLYHWLAGVGYFHLGGTFNGFHAEPFEQSPRNAFWLPAIVDNYRLDESTCIAFINMASKTWTGARIQPKSLSRENVIILLKGVSEISVYVVRYLFGPPELLYCLATPKRGNSITCRPSHSLSVIIAFLEEFYCCKRS